MTTTYSIVKICNNCDTQNREDVNTCRECGELMVSKDNRSKLYGDFGKIHPFKRGKRPQTVTEYIEENEKFKIRK